MYNYIVLCCVLLVGVITLQSWGRSVPSLHTVWYEMTPEEFWLKKHRSASELKPFVNHKKNEDNTKKNEEAALRQLLEDFGKDIVDDVNILKNAQQILLDQYAVDLAYDTQVKKNYAHKEHDAGVIHDIALVNDDDASENEVGDEIIIEKTYA